MSFEDYVNGDSHNHPDFDTQVACFASHLGRQRQRGDKSAKLYIIDQADLRSRYDKLLLQRTSGLARKSASSIVNNSIEVYTNDQSLFKALNQTTEWQEEGGDYLALFKEYQRTVTDEVFASLANDLIVDLTPLSSRVDSFPHFINLNKGLEALKVARRGREMTRTVNNEWPAFKEISSRVFAQGVQSYRDVQKNIAKEDQLHPMVMYMQSIILS
ncbi:hypothetical protein BGZ65_006128, partial [Modicella reniformis]